MKRIFAIDQAADNNGVCRLLETRAGQPLYEAGKFTLDPKTKDKRLMDLYWYVQNELDGEEYSLVVMEKPLQVHASGIVLHEISGVIKLACLNMEVPYLVVTPVHLKQWATGKHTADKDSVLLAAHKRFGESITSNDVADAAFLCEIGFFYATGEDPGNEMKRGILAKLHAGPVKKARKKVAA